MFGVLKLLNKHKNNEPTNIAVYRKTNNYDIVVIV